MSKLQSASDIAISHTHEFIVNTLSVFSLARCDLTTLSRSAYGLCTGPSTRANRAVVTTIIIAAIVVVVIVVIVIVVIVIVIVIIFIVVIVIVVVDIIVVIVVAIVVVIVVVVAVIVAAIVVMITLAMDATTVASFDGLLDSCVPPTRKAPLTLKVRLNHRREGPGLIVLGEKREFFDNLIKFQSPQKVKNMEINGHTALITFPIAIEDCLDQRTLGSNWAAFTFLRTER
jgi:hypothetical protein